MTTARKGALPQLHSHATIWNIVHGRTEAIPAHTVNLRQHKKPPLWQMHGFDTQHQHFQRSVMHESAMTWLVSWLWEERQDCQYTSPAKKNNGSLCDYPPDSSEYWVWRNLMCSYTPQEICSSWHSSNVTLPAAMHRIRMAYSQIALRIFGHIQARVCDSCIITASSNKQMKMAEKQSWTKTTTRNPFRPDKQHLCTRLYCDLALFLSMLLGWPAGFVTIMGFAFVASLTLRCHPRQRNVQEKEVFCINDAGVKRQVADFNRLLFLH